MASTTGNMLTVQQLEQIMRRHSTTLHYALLDYRGSREILDEYTDSAIWEMRRVEKGYPPSDDPEWTADMQADCDSYVQQLNSWKTQMNAMYDGYTGENGGANHSYEIAKRVTPRV